MSSDPLSPLLASDGATFSGLVAEVSNGWRASGVLQLKKVGAELEQQIVGPLIFPSNDAAQGWLQEIGKDHGFASVHIVIRRLSEAEKQAKAAPADNDDRAGTFWER